MTDPQVGVLMLGLFIFTIFLGFPIAFTLVALGVFFGYYAMGDNVFQLLVQRAFGVMSNDVLIAVPLFLFMGYMVERSIFSNDSSTACKSRPSTCPPRSPWRRWRHVRCSQRPPAS